MLNHALEAHVQILLVTAWCHTDDVVSQHLAWAAPSHASMDHVSDSVGTSTTYGHLPDYHTKVTRIWSLMCPLA